MQGVIPGHKQRMIRRRAEQRARVANFGRGSDRPKQIAEARAQWCAFFRDFHAGRTGYRALKRSWLQRAAGRAA